MSEYYIPAAIDQIIDTMLSDTADPKEREELAHVLRLLDEHNHRKWRVKGIEVLRKFRRLRDDPEARAGLLDEVRLLLERANFEAVSKADVDFALEDKQLFELPIVIDWERFEGEPLIYARGRSEETVESRFFFRKLSYYMLHGSLGVVLISLLFLGLGWASLEASKRADLKNTIMSTPRFESSETLGPGDAETFHVFFGDGKEEAVRWRLYDANDAQLTGEIADGAPAQLRIEGESATLLVSDDLPNERVLLRLEAELPSSGDVVLSRGFAVERPVSPPPLARIAGVLGWVLLALGALGLLAGLLNFVKGLGADAETRSRWLAKGLGTLQERTRERTLKLRVDRFRHLFRKEKIVGEVLSRVVVAVQMKGEKQPLLKLFRDIPLADLEVIFPATRVRMRFKDRILLGFSIFFAVIIVAIKVVALLSAAFFALWLMVIAFVSVGGVAARTWQKFRNTVRRYTSTLTESLYYLNLDNDEGVLHFLVHHVEEQEIKESAIAYFLLSRSESGMLSLELGDAADKWLTERVGVSAHFETADALQKLGKLGLFAEAGPEARLQVLPHQASRAHLEATLLP